MAKAMVAGALLLAAPLAHAQCSMDTECKGDRVCEGGTCVAPAAQPLPPPPAAPDATAATTPPAAPAPRRPPPAEPPKMQRHSKGMMAGGIVMVSLAPVAFVIAGFASLAESLCEIDDNYQSRCDDNSGLIYGSLLAGAGLLGAGIPLIVIGAKKEPVQAASATAVIAPWATQNAAGLGLRVDL